MLVTNEIDYNHGPTTTAENIMMFSATATLPSNSSASSQELGCTH